MSFFYFFKHDGACKYMIKEILNSFPRFLHEPIEYEGKKVKFYTILKWVQTKTRGANQPWLDEIGINYVNSIDELPSGSGVYITGYDADLEEVNMLKKAGVNIIDHPCPWIKELRQQLLDVNKDTHQCILMIDHDHMVHDCYKSIFPDDIIVVQAENFEEKIRKYRNGKPFHLLIYAAHREKDAANIVQFINQAYPHPANNLLGYEKTLCCWSKQGLMEEIAETIEKNRLTEIWIVCSSELDRSTMSVMNQIKDSGALPVIIKKEEDIPGNIAQAARIGVLLAPIPLSKKVRNIINTIRRRHGNAKEILHILYEAFVINKVEEIVNDVTEDLVWKMEGNKNLVPIAGTFHGRDGLRQFFKVSKANIRAIEFDINEYIQEGNTVIVRIFEEGESLTTGKKFKTNICHIWKFTDDLKVKEFFSYNDTFALNEAFTPAN